MLNTYQDPNCTFCKINRGESPARIVGETSSTLAFIPLSPATVGHTLLIPKVHSSTLFDTDEDSLRSLIVASKHLATRIQEATGCDGMNIIQSNGSSATQTVDHYHMHLVPRNDGDGFGPIWPTRPVCEDAVEDFFETVSSL